MPLHLKTRTSHILGFFERRVGVAAKYLPGDRAICAVLFEQKRSFRLFASLRPQEAAQYRAQCNQAHPPQLPPSRRARPRRARQHNAPSCRQSSAGETVRAAGAAADAARCAESQRRNPSRSKYDGRPGIANARLASILRKRPCATEERKITALSCPGRLISATKVPRPRRKRRSSVRSIGRPM